MNKRTVTYGIKDMVEYHACYMAGKCSFNVCFTGGCMSGYGITPAQYTTSDPIVQNVIERSEDFKVGKVCILKQHSEQSEEPKKVKVAKAAANTSAQAAPASTNEPTAKEEKKTITAPCIEDARAILNEQYGVAQSKMRSKNEVLKMAELNGLNIVIE